MWGAGSGARSARGDAGFGMSALRERKFLLSALVPIQCVCEDSRGLLAA